MQYLRVIGWEKFQHYKKRSPPWIKLHTTLLDNDGFEKLQDASKLLLLCLWLYTARKGNGNVTTDVKQLKRKLPIIGKIELQPLIDAGFIEVIADDKHDASKVLGSDRGERETESETESETEREKSPSSKKKFRKPTPQEVIEHAKTIGYELDGDQFCDYYESNGWKVGRNAMKCWKSAISTWKARDNDQANNGRSNSRKTRGGFTELEYKGADDDLTYQG